MQKRRLESGTTSEEEVGISSDEEEEAGPSKKWKQPPQNASVLAGSIENLTTLLNRLMIINRVVSEVEVKQAQQFITYLSLNITN